MFSTNVVMTVGLYSLLRFSVISYEDAVRAAPLLMVDNACLLSLIFICTLCLEIFGKKIRKFFHTHRMAGDLHSSQPSASLDNLSSYFPCCHTKLRKDTRVA